MINTLKHPLVADYLRELDTALAGLPAAVAAELSEQIRAHLPAAGQGQAEAAGASHYSVPIRFVECQP